MSVVRVLGEGEAGVAQKAGVKRGLAHREHRRHVMHQEHLHTNFSCFRVLKLAGWMEQASHGP